MSIFALPAIISLFLKIILFAYAWRAPRHNAKTRLFMVLLILFSLHNAVEVFGLNHFAVYGFDKFMERCGYLYFFFGIPFFAVLLHLSLALSVDAWPRYARYAWILYVPVPILEYLLLGTDQLVTGFQVMNQYTILRVPGPLYFLFETYAPLYLVATVVYLLYGARPSRSSVINRIRNRYWLLGLLPFVLLNIYLITANHFGLAKLSSTVFNPMAVTIFLIVTTYATHQYRLFDIEFFIPWSKVRKRKTVFYQRIQATIAEVADLQSVREVLQLLADTFRCPVTLIGGLRPVVATEGGRTQRLVAAKEVIAMAELPRDALEKIDHIVIAHEIEDAMPRMYSLMKQHHVAAIVPFYPRAGAAANWMLLGDPFSEEVYTPLDFRMVEQLFDRIGDRFLDKLSLLRSQLEEVRQEMREVQQRLAVAWEDKILLRKDIDVAEAENSKLRARNAKLLRGKFTIVTPSNIPLSLDSNKTLDEYLVDFEIQIIKYALEYCEGNRLETARLLGLRPNMLRHRMRRLGLNNDD